ncbi:MAG: AAA family ATPase [Planctomycetota bacterium]|jgi:pilus assembly protein CpaE
MKSGVNIVLTTDSETFAEAFSEVVKSHREVSIARTCHGLPELRAYLEHSKVPVAILDIDPNPPKMLGELDHLVSLYPETRFAVISSRSNKELILEAMQVGARHFIHKKFIEVEFDRILEKLLVEATKTQAELGRVISVFSAGGGCGSTTVALNLANELRLKSGEPILAIDLDDSYGGISSYLGLSGQFGIREVLDQKDRIDSQLIESSATSYKDDFDVLLSPVSIEDNDNLEIQYSNLFDALEACKCSYKYTIIDAPRIHRQTMRVLANNSKLNLVVMQPNVKDIKVAKSIIEALRGFGIPSKRIFPVINRFRRRGPLVPLQEAKKALGFESLYSVRNDFRKVVNSINRAEPLSEAVPFSGIRRDFQKLAMAVSSFHDNGNGKILE